MSDKEMLKIIKRKYMDYEYDYNLKKTDINWLIEQAERVQELEEGYKVRKTEYLEEHIERLEGKLGLYMEILETREEAQIIAEYQNKRYREAREIIEQVYKDNYVRNTHGYEDGYLDGLDTAMDIIDKALEESKND